ncbi:insulin-like growth factor-binding protein 6 [Falco rusticolus]|uniref:insulin-like growth factor-binding protein 6 n=1 Tax=Falco rusticolus TaxID=120794 RepID=UPI0018867B6B|nr:insulin-like growth factor-binding protein 6 [Falco rusticolus]
MDGGHRGKRVPISGGWGAPRWRRGGSALGFFFGGGDTGSALPPPGDSPQEGAPATPPPGPPPADGTEELDTAPCRGHLAAVLQELRAGLFRSAAALFLPNCDTRGFYRPKQCRASQGPKRGQCWCVDRRGHPLAGTEGQGGAPRCPPT